MSEREVALKENINNMKYIHLRKNKPQEKDQKQPKTRKKFSFSKKPGKLIGKHNLLGPKT